MSTSDPGGTPGWRERHAELAGRLESGSPYDAAPPASVQVDREALATAITEWLTGQFSALYVTDDDHPDDLSKIVALNIPNVIEELVADALGPLLEQTTPSPQVDREASRNDLRDALMRANEALNEWAQDEEWAAPLRTALNDVADVLAPIFAGGGADVAHLLDRSSLRREIVRAIRQSHGPAPEDTCCTIPERYADAVLAALAPLLGGPGPDREAGS